MHAYTSSHTHASIKDMQLNNIKRNHECQRGAYVHKQAQACAFHIETCSGSSKYCTPRAHSTASYVPSAMKGRLGF